MADKLKTLMGVAPRKHTVSLAAIPSATLSIPGGMASAAGLAPAVGSWLEVVNVTGAGRLRGAVLVVGSSWPGYQVSMRITRDGEVYTKDAVIGAGNSTYILVPEMQIGSDLCLLPEIPFSGSLKIEVARSYASIPAMALHYFYQLEA
jgi:hypothetical protein